jgi:hypothetical protein
MKKESEVYKVINSIIESIRISLDMEFGDGYEVYREDTGQGLQGPCFFILCTNTEDRRFLNRRYFRTSQFCVRYIPADGEKKQEECHAAAKRLFQCLEWLDVQGDPVMGRKMKYEVEEGVLRFFVNYDMFVYKGCDPVPWMEEISSATSVKGEKTE